MTSAASRAPIRPLVSTRPSAWLLTMAMTCLLGVGAGALGRWGLGVDGSAGGLVDRGREGGRWRSALTMGSRG